MHPRLLLISSHFPPGQGAGALRWEKLSSQAARRGWGVDAIALDAADLPAPDWTRLEGLPQTVRFFGVRRPVTRTGRVEDALHRLYRRLRPKPAVEAPGPAAGRSPPRARGAGSFRREDVRLAPWRPRSWVRLYGAWLDYANEGAWARGAARLGRELFDPSVHRAVVSCGPPHMAHEGARLLSEATRLPLVMDLRDPWSLWNRLPEYLASPLWLWLARSYEKRCVDRAALVVMNNELARRAMQERYPDRADRIVAVYNGWDEDESMPRVAPDGSFRIAYAGGIYLDRNPRALFRAAGRVVRELGLGPRDLAIEFMGPIEGVDGDRSFLQIVAEEGVEGLVRVHPPGTRGEAMRFLARASVLVNLPQDSHLAIPSKIFEYMRFDAWLLALAERGSGTELLLRDTGAEVVAPDDVDALAAFLRRCYADFAAGRRPRPIATDPRLGRRAQADRLFDALEQITGRPEKHP